MKIVCFDIDGVICNQTDGDYDQAIPNQDIIDLINRLFEKGYEIRIFTSRYMGRTNEDAEKSYNMGFEHTKQQLKDWGVRFHKLNMGKPRYDIFIDDKSAFFKLDPLLIENEIKEKV